MSYVSSHEAPEHGPLRGALYACVSTTQPRRSWPRYAPMPSTEAGPWSRRMWTTASPAHERVGRRSTA